VSIPRKTIREYFYDRGCQPGALSPVHPGEILLEDYLRPMGISQTELAADIGVPLRRINEICLGKRAMSPETAWLLAEYFDMSVEFWAGLQQQYDLQALESTIAPKLKRVRPCQKLPSKQTA
jgi:addiction module HigA family antidote